MVRDPVLDTTYGLIDGLDECDKTSLEMLLTKSKRLFSTQTSESSVCHLRLMVISRAVPECISKKVSNFPRIRLHSDIAMEVNSDIQLFIDAKVEELSEFRRYSTYYRNMSKEFSKIVQKVCSFGWEL